MSTIKYPGKCFICAKEVKPGKGDFQSVGSLKKSEQAKYRPAKWLVRCFNCKGVGNKPQI